MKDVEMRTAVSNNKASLGELEWKVVNMALDDGPRSLKPEGLMARISRDLFGFPVPQKLANARLEALRRFCVRAWHWDVVRLRDVRTLIDAGYSRADVRRILAHVGSYRGFVPSLAEEPA
jgi:hypothetical protein